MVKRNQFFENRHPGIKIAFKIGVSDANRAKCKQTNECKQKITSCVKKLQFIISKNLDATLSVTGTLAPFGECVCAFLSFVQLFFSLNHYLLLLSLHI